MNGSLQVEHVEEYVKFLINIIIIPINLYETFEKINIFIG